MIATRSPCADAACREPARDQVGCARRSRRYVVVRSCSTKAGFSGVAATARRAELGQLPCAERRKFPDEVCQGAEDGIAMPASSTPTHRDAQRSSEEKTTVDADEIMERFGLAAAPGRRDVRGDVARRTRAPASARRGTAIYFLLRAGERSHWHRVDATEIWHYYAGAPLELQTSADGRATVTRVLGADLASGHVPQLVVRAGRVAGRTIARRVDARRLHRLARVRLRRLRARAGRAGNLPGPDLQSLTFTSGSTRRPPEDP